ncbi:MAG: CheR family methyltransferase [bacterium]
MYDTAEKFDSVTMVQPAALIPLSDREYRLIRELVYQKFGINLTEKKRSLVTGRLSRIVTSSGFTNFEDYYDFVVSDKTGDAIRILVDRISTNHTFFYRESDHFEYLYRTVLPEYARKAKMGRGPKVLRIWCSASSSGEEPYTLAMILHEYFKDELSAWDIGVLATDISTDILNVARNGVYQDENVAKLPTAYRNKYFDRLTDGSWAIKSSIKEVVLFRRLNLIQRSYPFKGRFQIIFSRNVMIYFDERTRKALVRRYHRYLEPQGYLFIGHSESLGRNNGLYRYVKPAVYRKEPIVG